MTTSVISNIEPEKQYTYIDSGSGRLFDFNNVDSRVYLSRTINDLLKVFGSDVVIYGLQLDNLDFNGSILSVDVKPGKAIIDTTLVDIESTTTLMIDTTPYDINTGYFIVALSYSYVESIYQNVARLRLLYVDRNGNTVDCWNFKRDRIVLCKLKVDSVLNVAIPENCCANCVTNTIRIRGQVYDICPKDSITQNILNIVECGRPTEMDYSLWWLLGTEVPNPKTRYGLDVYDITLGTFATLT